MALFSQDDQKAEGEGIWNSFESERQESRPGAAGRLSRTTTDDGTVLWDFARPPRRHRVAIVGAAVGLFGGWLLVSGGTTAAVDAVPQPVSQPSTAVASPAPLVGAVAQSLPGAVAPGSSVPAVPVAPAEPASPSTTLVRTYSVQVAAKPEGPEVDDLRHRLSQGGYPVYLEPITAGATRLVRVRVGPLVSLADAEAMSARLRSDGHEGPWIATGESHAPSALSIAQAGN